ncbi:putative NBD/HSP70 family sugar kinase [Microbacterium paludicola]|uniref:NBD/HSP70 family sugar kinase n=1 Tax=Microbacterium paludicola TaxID=300019 RepID=A0ABU1I3Q6_9MICO|nr:ROK family transcriptional regulator [Microbacterium paludicola]MDR6168147.1 putative NBD/HSP70 family sugar kinase [Microbacterium paludicola]
MTTTSAEGAVSPRARGRRIRPEDARSNNRRLVLQALHREEGLSRADIARATGLSRVTISDLVGELVDEQLVVESGRGHRSGPGAPSRALALARSSRNVVAVSISSGDTIEGAVVDLGGTVIAREVVERGGSTGAEALAVLGDLIDRLVRTAEAPILGIGVSTPGVVDGAGVVRESSHLDWHDVALRGILFDRTGLPVSVTNGLNAAGMGELSFGKVDHDLLLVRIGAGVGAAAIVNGAVVHGRNWAAGEIGHVVVTEGEGPVCACGRTGCLEAWLSVPKLEARLAAAPDAEAALHVRREAGRCLGIALSPLVATLGLTDVVLSGPAELIEGALIDAASEAIASRVLPILFDDLTVRLAETHGDLRLRGAAALVLSETLGLA